MGGSWVQAPQEANFMLAIQHFDKNSQLAGFEPTRAEPIGFQVQRLNHSATTAGQLRDQQKKWRCGGSNPGPFTCKANALPLSYIPAHGRLCEKGGRAWPMPTANSKPAAILLPTAIGLLSARPC